MSLQALINATTAGHTLNLNGKTYTQSSYISITKNITIKNGFITRDMDNPDPDISRNPVMEVVGSGSGTNSITVTLENLGFYFIDHTNYKTPIAIRISNCRKVEIINCNFHNHQLGVYGYGGRSHEIILTNCRSATTPVPYQFLSDYTTVEPRPWITGALLSANGRFLNCTIDKCQVVGWGALVQSANNDNDVECNYSVTNCLAYRTEDSSIYLRGGNNIVTGNLIIDAGKDGIKIRPVIEYNEDPIPNDYFFVYPNSIPNGGSIVSYNTIINSGVVKSDGGTALQAQYENVSFLNNTIFLGDTSSYADGGFAGVIIGSESVGCTVSGNLINGVDTESTETTAIKIDSGATDVSITNNTISKCRFPIILDGTYVPADNISITNNIVEGEITQGLQTSAITRYQWTSAHTADNTLWDAPGLIFSKGTYWWSNFYPSQLDALANNSGGRACVYQDAGSNNVSVEVIWSGLHSTQAGPVVCINPTNNDFGIGLSIKFDGSDWKYSLYKVGRNPTQMAEIGYLNLTTAHIEGTEVVLKIVVNSNNVLTYYADGVALTLDIGGTYALSSTNLSASYLHGAVMQIEKNDSRPGHLACAKFPFIIT